MPNPQSFADIFRDWDLLLEATADNAEALAAAEPQRQELEKTFKELREAKARQQSYAALRQQATQEIAVLVTRGREQALRLRGMAKGLLGPHKERLVQFRVAPIRTGR